MNPVWETNQLEKSLIKQTVWFNLQHRENKLKCLKSFLRRPELTQCFSLFPGLCLTSHHALWVAVCCTEMPSPTLFLKAASVPLWHSQVHSAAVCQPKWRYPLLLITGFFFHHPWQLREVLPHSVWCSLCHERVNSQQGPNEVLWPQPSGTTVFNPDSWDTQGKVILEVYVPWLRSRWVKWQT